MDEAKENQNLRAQKKASEYGLYAWTPYLFGNMVNHSRILDQKEFTAIDMWIVYDTNKK